MTHTQLGCEVTSGSYTSNWSPTSSHVISVRAMSVSAEHVVKLLQVTATQHDRQQLAREIIWPHVCTMHNTRGKRAKLLINNLHPSTFAIARSLTRRLLAAGCDGRTNIDDRVHTYRARNKYRTLCCGTKTKNNLVVISSNLSRPCSKGGSARTETTRHNRSKLWSLSIMMQQALTNYLIAQSFTHIFLSPDLSAFVHPASLATTQRNCAGSAACKRKCVCEFLSDSGSR